MNEREKSIDQLHKLIARADWTEPNKPIEDASITTILAGIWLQTNARMVLEALRRMD